MQLASSRLGFPAEESRSNKVPKPSKRLLLFWLSLRAAAPAPFTSPEKSPAAAVTSKLAEMPSLALSSPIVSSEETKKKSKSKKHKSADPEEAPEISPMDDGGGEKKIKSKKKYREEKKKRKSSDEEEKSDTTSDSDVTKGVPPAAKKPKLMNVEAGTRNEDGEVVVNADEDAAASDPNALQNFRISQALRDLLHSKGIKTLFPIQAKTFDLILDGSDMVGRARTGQVRINLIALS